MQLKDLVTFLRLLVVLAPTSLATTAFAAPSRLAVVIGNSKYQHEQPLKNPQNDARTVASSLRQSGQFDTIVERYDLSRRQLFALVREIESLGAGRDAILVYFAGHGMQGNTSSDLVSRNRGANRFEEDRDNRA